MSLHQLLPIEKRGAEGGIRLLYFGRESSPFETALKRHDDCITCVSAVDMATIRRIFDGDATGQHFDFILCDMLDRDRSDATGVAMFGHIRLVAIEKGLRLVVICDPIDRVSCEALPGVDLVIPAPVDPETFTAELAALALSEPAKQHAFISPLSSEPVGKPEAEQDVETPVHNSSPASAEENDTNAVTQGFELSTEKRESISDRTWRGFVPIVNFLYKKLAMVMLTTLFLTFVHFGVLIVFFLASSSWSLPFQLSRGHALVERMEKDLSFIKVQKNRLEQDLVDARIVGSKAIRANRDSRRTLQLLEETIAEEARRLQNRADDIRSHIHELESVVAEYQSLNHKEQVSEELNNAYEQRIITKSALDSGNLVAIEMRHRMAAIRHEIKQNRRDLEEIDVNAAFLNSLLDELHKPEITRFGATEFEYSNLAAKVVKAKTDIAETAQDYEASQNQIIKLNVSLEVYRSNLTSLESTPTARALHEPIQVIFVPYDNALATKTGVPLYTCRFSIFWCVRVGEVGASISGETTITHPLFGKPVRGVFVEAQLYTWQAVTEEIVHAGRPPFFF